MVNDGESEPRNLSPTGRQLTTTMIHRRQAEPLVDPSTVLDKGEMYKHIEEQLNKVKEIAPSHRVQPHTIYKEVKNSSSSNPPFISMTEKASTLYFTIVLYNNI